MESEPGKGALFSIYLPSAGKSPLVEKPTEATTPLGQGEILVMDGEEAIGHLRQIDPQVKAVVSSGYANDPIMARFSEYGFCGVVPKPFSLQDLSELLQIILNS